MKQLAANKRMQLVGASGRRNVGWCPNEQVAAADARLIRRTPDKSLSEVFLEFGFLLLVVVSAALGFALRGFVSPTLARACALIGLASLVSGLGILGLTASGRSPFDTLTGGLVAAVALGIAGLILPFALVVGRGRF